MTLVRWTPKRRLDPFAGLLDLQRTFSNLLAPTAQTEDEFGNWVPAVDVYSDENAVVVQAEVPGLDRKDIEVNLDEGILTIKGERKHEKERKENGYHFVERAYGKFYRAIRVPAEVDGTKVKAEMKEGVLTITLPKAEQAKARQIEIEPK
jgi:HSP20 family protein